MSGDADRGKLTIALGLIVGFMLFELVVGALEHSLALLSDAAHMLTDAGAIGLSLVAIRLAARPAKGAMTFGLKRTEILWARCRRFRAAATDWESVALGGSQERISGHIGDTFRLKHVL